jgi:hypothetical protein
VPASSFVVAPSTLSSRAPRLARTPSSGDRQTTEPQERRSESCPGGPSAAPR